MDKVMKLLNENRVMTLATVCGDQPRSSILEYVMVGGAMIFATDPNSKKGKNLAKNNKVSLTLGTIPEDIMQAVYMAIDGTVAEASEKETEGYFKVLIERYPSFKEMLKSGHEQMPFKPFRVKFDTAYYSVGMAPAEVIKM